MKESVTPLFAALNPFSFLSVQVPLHTMPTNPLPGTTRKPFKQHAPQTPLHIKLYITPQEMNAHLALQARMHDYEERESPSPSLTNPSNTSKPERPQDEGTEIKPQGNKDDEQVNDRDNALAVDKPDVEAVVKKRGTRMQSRHGAETRR